MPHDCPSIPDAASPGRLLRVIHPEDGGRVRALQVAAGERLASRLQCDACGRCVAPEEIRAATAAEAARWAPAPVPAPPLATGQDLSPPHRQGGPPCCP